jgi:hypothetical protein
MRLSESPQALIKKGLRLANELNHAGSEAIGVTLEHYAGARICIERVCPFIHPPTGTCSGQWGGGLRPSGRIHRYGSSGILGAAIDDGIDPDLISPGS